MGSRQRKMVSTWEANTIMATRVIEVREEEEVQRLGKMKGDTPDRFGELRRDSGHCTEDKQKENWEMGRGETRIWEDHSFKFTSLFHNSNTQN